MAMPVWKDRRVERPNTYNIQTNIDGTITLIPVPGTIYEPGTPLNADNLNQINVSLDEIIASMSYKTINIDGINTGAITTLPSGCKEVIIIMTVNNNYKLFAEFNIYANSFISSFTFNVDQGAGYDSYIVNFVYDNNVLSFQKNMRFTMNAQGTITRTDITNAVDKTVYPRITHILCK